MAVFRVEKNRNYTTMSNYHLRDRNLSFKAKGLLSMCLSLTETWDYSVNGLVAISKEGRTSTLSTLRELERAGYIKREQSRGSDGKLGKAVYVIYEIPIPREQAPRSEKPWSGFPTTDNPTAENPTADNPTSENPPQLNTEQLNTERLNTEQSTDGAPGASKSRYGRNRNVLLSEAEFSALKTEFPNDYQARIDRLSDYMANRHRSYPDHYATIRKWAIEDAARNSKGRFVAGNPEQSSVTSTQMDDINWLQEFMRKHEGEFDFPEKTGQEESPE